jgi:hypothetical protein
MMTMVLRVLGGKGCQTLDRLQQFVGAVLGMLKVVLGFLTGADRLLYKLGFISPRIQHLQQSLCSETMLFPIVPCRWLYFSPQKRRSSLFLRGVGIPFRQERTYQ